MNKRNEIFFAVIEKLNDENRPGTYFIDCGELGLMQIWFNPPWDCQWFDRPIKLDRFMSNTKFSKEVNNG